MDNLLSEVNMLGIATLIPDLHIDEAIDWDHAELLKKGGFSNVYKYGVSTALKVITNRKTFKDRKCAYNEVAILNGVTERSRYDYDGYDGRLHIVKMEGFRITLTDDPVIFFERCDVNLHDFADLGGLKSLLKFEKIDILKQMCRGFKYLHDKNILHRDIKPTNIMLNISKSNKICVKIIDFGQSTMQTNVANENGDLLMVNVQVHNMVRAEHEQRFYKAPEAIKYQRLYTKASDVYSFGFIVYFVIHGEPVNHFWKMKVNKVNQHIFLQNFHTSIEFRDWWTNDWLSELARMLMNDWNNIMRGMVTKMTNFEAKKRPEFWELCNDLDLVYNNVVTIQNDSPASSTDHYRESLPATGQSAPMNKVEAWLAQHDDWLAHANIEQIAEDKSRQPDDYRVRDAPRHVEEYDIWEQHLGEHDRIRNQIKEKLCLVRQDSELAENARLKLDHKLAKLKHFLGMM